MNSKCFSLLVVFPGNLSDYFEELLGCQCTFYITVLVVLSLIINSKYKPFLFVIWLVFTCDIHVLDIIYRMMY